MKNLSSLLIVIVFLTSCSAVKKTAADPPPKKEPTFKENVSIKPTESTPKASVGWQMAKHAVLTTPSGIEAKSELQFKYAILLNLPVECEFNLKALGFIDEWYGVPYRFGGSTKTGVDCSAFASFFMSAVYSIALPRRSQDQYNLSKRIKKNDLKEGDLVFFNTRGGISHVGVYIGYKKFAHASTSNGVIISDLEEPYFQKRYVASGRVR